MASFWAPRRKTTGTRMHAHSANSKATRAFGFGVVFSALNLSYGGSVVRAYRPTGPTPKSWHRRIGRWERGGLLVHTVELDREDAFPHDGRSEGHSGDPLCVFDTAVHQVFQSDSDELGTDIGSRLGRPSGVGRFLRRPSKKRPLGPRNTLRGGARGTRTRRPLVGRAGGPLPDRPWGILRGWGGRLRQAYSPARIRSQPSGNCSRTRNMPSPARFLRDVSGSRQ